MSKIPANSPVARGFTLVELLVVISIVALLVAMLLPTLSSARESGRLAMCAVNQRSISQASNLHASDHQGFYPAFMDSLLQGTGAGAGNYGRVDTTPDNLEGNSGKRYTYMRCNDGLYRTAPLPAALSTYLGWNVDMDNTLALGPVTWPDGYGVPPSACLRTAYSLAVPGEPVRATFTCPSDPYALTRTTFWLRWSTGPNPVFADTTLTTTRFQQSYSCRTFNSYAFSINVLGWARAGNFATYASNNVISTSSNKYFFKGQVEKVSMPSQVLLGSDGAPTTAGTTMTDDMYYHATSPNKTLWDVLTSAASNNEGNYAVLAYNSERHGTVANVSFVDGHVGGVRIPRAQFTAGGAYNNTAVAATGDAGGTQSVYIVAPR